MPHSTTSTATIQASRTSKKEPVASNEPECGYRLICIGGPLYEGLHLYPLGPWWGLRRSHPVHCYPGS